MTTEQKQIILNQLNEATSALMSIDEEYGDIDFDNDLGIMHPCNILGDINGLIDFIKEAQ